MQDADPRTQLGFLRLLLLLLPQNVCLPATARGAQTALPHPHFSQLRPAFQLPPQSGELHSAQTQQGPSQRFPARKKVQLKGLRALRVEQELTGKHVGGA